MLVLTPPAVGIFWRVDDVLVIDHSSVNDAEPYGDCITPAAGHYERWLEWQTLGAARLKAVGYPLLIIASEYDDWPRGRIVYETPARRFVLYADKRLQTSTILTTIKAAFGPNDASVVVMSDQHYC